MPFRFLKTASSVASGQTPAIVASIVKGVIDDVRVNGDNAVRTFSERFDKWSPKSFRLSEEEIKAALAKVPKQTIADIKEAQQNVRTFALAQRRSLSDFELEIQPGVHLGQKNVPISSVGAYIPGGRYPMIASAHMTIVTAKAAGVKNVIACTPPINGEIPNATVAAMFYAGADAIYILGGIQAIAAMVDFIAGPGNAFVAEGKRQLFGEIGIDLFAGPTEILIVADEYANPFTIATDLLSQAEHGLDSPAVLITTSETVGRQAIRYVYEQLKSLSTAQIAGNAWKSFGEVVVVDNLDEGYALADEYAFEHVQVFTRYPREALDKMKNYGALFLGEKTCVSYGDKVIGTNHVLPTRKASKYTGGLWVGKFLRTVTYQEVSTGKASGELGRLCGRAARAENFEGHARSGDLRASIYLKDNIPWIPQAKL